MLWIWTCLKDTFISTEEVDGSCEVYTVGWN